MEETMSWFQWLRDKFSATDELKTPDQYAESLFNLLKIMSKEGDKIDEDWVDELPTLLAGSDAMLEDHGPSFAKAVLDQIQLKSSKHAALLARLWRVHGEFAVDLRSPQERKTEAASK